ncbi:LysM peptidoglycan-binding domain-containing protein [Bacillus sp. PS06]|uniref:LysM peptidoglycan-binding domain-containing protein n=1 Tax=Bacillus sp. PS06 TaxID=2764176 RepID=UPI00177C5593|nr:LysM peptidoglycan-binding domain-containing protein [Bacillus sp. PS06]MBD8070286.1 LysM peptidoglycan-binding domain-containing protein [Bacillus sp. PS06]
MNNSNDEFKESFKEGGLPPRSEYHQTNPKKTKFKIKFPVVRLLGFFFILLILTIVCTTIYFNDYLPKPSFVSKDLQNVETVKYANQKKMDSNTLIGSELLESQGEEVGSDTPKESESEKQVSSEEVRNDPVEEQPEVKQPSVPKEKPASVEYEVKYHTVKANETLYRISNMYYHSRAGEQLIKEWNHIKDNQIYQGQVLKIPMKVEETK